VPDTLVGKDRQPNADDLSRPRLPWKEVTHDQSLPHLLLVCIR